MVLRKQALNHYHAITITNSESLFEENSRVLFEDNESDWVGGGDSGEACNLTPEGPMSIKTNEKGKEHS